MGAVPIEKKLGFIIIIIVNISVNYLRLMQKLSTVYMYVRVCGCVCRCVGARVYFVASYIISDRRD